MRETFSSVIWTYSEYYYHGSRNFNITLNSDELHSFCHSAAVNSVLWFILSAHSNDRVPTGTENLEK